MGSVGDPAGKAAQFFRDHPVDRGFQPPPQAEDVFGPPSAPKHVDRVVAIEDGTGLSLATRVNTDNNLGTEARYGRISVAITNETVGMGSVQVLGTTAGRLQLTLQNLDDTNSIHFRLGGGTATTSDPRLDPGQSFSLPPGIAFEGPVTAYATGAGTPLSIMEYKL